MSQPPVLLSIDVVRDFVEQMASAARSKLIASTNALAEIVRTHGGSVIWVRQEFAPDLSDAFLEMRGTRQSVTIAGTPGAKFDPDLHVMDADEIVVKKRYSAFFGTDLDARLEHSIGAPLIVSGLNTHACVRMTAIDAYQRDWRVILASDCLYSYDSAHHDVSMRYMDGKIATALTNDQLAQTLAKQGLTG